MIKRTDSYYEARGFSVYYLANAIFNIVSSPTGYIRSIEEILGDMKTAFFMQPFKRCTNLHEFVRCIALDIIVDDVEREDGDTRYLVKFLQTHDVPFPPSALEGAEAFFDFTAESDCFHDAIEEISDEIFHVLFNDVGFLQSFNILCAGYIESSGVGDQYVGRNGTLKRKTIPIWARRAIFHRDKGECRACKRSLAAIINRLDTERYDHIVPLARFGANDVTNLQLLCERCNLEKSAREMPVSRLYQRAFSKNSKNE